MTKFRVDIPESAEGSKRPQFKFRDADPVEVGGKGPDKPNEDHRTATLGSTISALIKAHDNLQHADTQLFELVEMVTALKNGDSVHNPSESGQAMIDIIRGDLLRVLVTLDQPLLVLDMENRGVLGEHDDREFARLGLKLYYDTREAFKRWGVSTNAPLIPDEVLESMKQAVAEMEAESK